MTTSENVEPEVDNRTFRLAQRERTVDPEFLPEEYLYRRCRSNELDPDDPVRLFPDLIKFYPDWSVNREKYSEPEDVLFLDSEFADSGVAAFQVKDIPAPMKTEGGISYHWDAQHRPLEENYSHSEIWTYKSGHHLANRQADTEPHPPSLPSKVKKYFRTVLSERARIICPPLSASATAEIEGANGQSEENTIDA